MSRPGLGLGVRVSVLIFHKLKIIFILTIDISMCKIMIRSGILDKKYDLSNVKNFQRNSLLYPEMIRRPLFCFKDTKNTG